MIREANSADSLNLAALSIQVWLHTYASSGIRKEISSFVFNTFTKEYFNNLLTDPDYRVLVFIKENHLVGYILANLLSYWQDRSNGYEIDKLYVHEYFQGQGVGRSLLSELALRYGGTFWLSTWVHNENAIKFYKHFGFVDIGHTWFQITKNELHENRIMAYKNT